MRSNRLIPAAALSAVLVSTAVAQQVPACFDQNIGTPITLNDDSVVAGLQLSFPFPINGLQGVTTQAIDVSSNGSVYLETGVETSSRCCNGTQASFLSSTATIAMMWHDLNPTQGGSVHFNSTATKATVTFLGVPEYNNVGSNTFQLALYPDGTFDLLYAETTAPASHTGMVGFTPGNGATDPGSTDISASTPFQTGAEPTVYELFGAGTGDFAFTSYKFIPNGSGGWLIIDGNCAGLSSIGRGCPSPATFYEVFATAGNDLSGTSVIMSLNTAGTGYSVRAGGPGQFLNGFTNNLALGDDQLLVAQPLGFTIPVPGAGLVSDLDISSNGWVAPTGFFTGSDFSESVAEFLAEATRWALNWDDLNPSNGGGVYFDTINGVAVVTYDQVPQFANSDANTFQLQIRPDATIVMVWQQVLDDCLVGFTVGNGANDPGPLDISASLPFAISGGTPLAHNADAAPALGTTVTWSVDNIPGGAALVALNFGLANPGLDLSLIGAPGCSLLASTEATVAMPAPTNGTSIVSLSIPTNNSLIGSTLFSQGVVAGVTSNSIGIITSNGLANRFGL